MSASGRILGHSWIWSVGCVALGCVLGYMLSEHGCDRPFIGPKDGRKVFAKATRWNNSTYVGSRLPAAKEIASGQEGPQWTVLLLLNSQLRPVNTEDPLVIARYKQARYMGLPGTAIAIGNLPERADPSILWALTYLLGDEGDAKWSGNVFGIPCFMDYGSPPIREMAHDYLKRRFNVDHGWDAVAWQAEIMGIK